MWAVLVVGLLRAEVRQAPGLRGLGLARLSRSGPKVFQPEPPVSREPLATLPPPREDLGTDDVFQPLPGGGENDGGGGP